ncbi:hypothetical protein ACWEFL_34575 [Streptomyces sp. NPDC004838]
MTAHRMTTRPATVPYITAWSRELPLPGGLTARPATGLAYHNETAPDRDDDGALWLRINHDPTGTPEFRRVHPTRQAHTMRNLLCQICRTPADRNEHGYLFLLPNHTTDWDGWPENMINTHPPLCTGPCIEAAAHCPHLTRGIAIRVRKPLLHGIHGTRYHLTPTGHLQPTGQTTISYDNPTLPWTLAHQLTRQLNHCTTDPDTTTRLRRAARENPTTGTPP